MSEFCISRTEVTQREFSDVHEPWKRTSSKWFEPYWQVPAGDENNLGPLSSLLMSSSAGPIVEPPKQGMSQG